MASNRLSRLVLILAALAFSAAAQSPTRVRGTISAFDGQTLTVDGKAQVVVGEKTQIVYAQPMTLAEIRPGDFLALTSTKRPDGSLTAYEVRRFPKPVSPGHGPFDGRDDQTMTNATVGAMVQSANAHELTMTYEGGSQKIVVPESAAVSTLVPGQRAQLVPGAPVNLTMDANRMALRIQVGPRP
jgi:uncharacterized protein DUF5666